MTTIDSEQLSYAVDVFGVSRVETVSNSAFKELCYIFSKVREGVAEDGRAELADQIHSIMNSTTALGAIKLSQSIADFENQLRRDDANVTSQVDKVEIDALAADKELCFLLADIRKSH